ncbi:LptF/LptG family permease [Henriciella marina]|uniref:LptF/LptG family permease n=1 Tax=Henriciella marina TaxID=453851 RepID=UPI0003824216|nr:LptF/LptG family permease [Henriciella marina]
MFTECVRLFASLCGLVLSILLIERLIRIVEVVADTENGALVAVSIIVNLIPHYLQLAIPAALFLAMIISIDRLSRSGELVTMLSAGLSLKHLSRPFFILAGIAAIASLIISGFLQPLGRYSYRQTVHGIQTQSFEAAFQEGRFVQIDDYTVWTEHREFGGGKLGSTFILETPPDGRERYISAPSGALLESEQGTVGLILENGRGATLLPPDRRDGTESPSVSFDRIRWPIEPETASFRARGNDERELTVLELGDVSAFPRVEQTAASALLHDQLSRAFLILILPVLAFPPGVNLGRRPRAGGIVLGVIALLIVQKALEYGLQTASTGAIPAWAGSWPVLVVTLCAGGYAFSRVAGESILKPDRAPSARNDDLAFTASGQDA